MTDSPVTIVTGAGRGIGRASALALGERGHRLVLGDSGVDTDGTGGDPDVLREVLDVCGSAGITAVGHDGDACSDEGVSALMKLALDSFGRVDAVVCSAGVRRDAGILKLGDAQLDASMHAHLWGPLRMMRAAGRHWTEARTPGRVVLVGGASAFFGQARQGAQAASQAALIALARSAAVELRRYEIQINVVIPTARTRLTRDTPLFKGIGGESMGPEHAATLIAFLLSEAGSAVHGEVLGVAGGRIYAIQSRETTGAFVEGRGFEEAEIADAWAEITRG